MKCSVFIATSADGYIATTKGDVDWLHTAGNPEANLQDHSDMGFNAFMNSVDCMIMGRKCMEMIAEMNLTPEQWLYGDIPIIVLSKTIKAPPENLQTKVTLFSGEIYDLIASLEDQGLKHAYIDGGSTITSFLKLKLITEMTITQVPILLGDGIPLFGKLDNSIKLVNAKAIAFENDFIQMTYQVAYE
ncbi:dihydrofolate reductase [Hydrogenovibrio sp. SC-1]|uniref:dihydrofolate reductase family protein n=1 Tax=Hydrogenovibrio sp. SC-1 TaxID=2065820 RepID=UPI000C7C6765|nr:dihydrofolate reductase family protein [Hydrogenovibrio sp. SC-1]PLA73794.1 dihydrofolate reductase [Hydrogenovibrio sp. SC-1]